MNKTASSAYAPEVMKVILNMKRDPNRYYVVINALGSMEVWGSNRNGDGFPKKGLKHVSLRSDMGTAEDYGYKTFEYYAKLFKHHVNKPDSPSFGEVIFSHWNEALQRVELIVAIDIKSGADIIEALDNGQNVAVSMGCKVRYDECSICGNLAKTVKKYCSHLKNHMGEVISKDLADKWSREFGKMILPGTVVYAINNFPRFFDISKVFIGADGISYVLGKAAKSGSITLSAEVADAYGVTDEEIDKLSMIGKNSEIDKKIGGKPGPGNIDGAIVKAKQTAVMKKAIDEKMNKTIAAEPIIEKETLDNISALPIEQIFSTMLGMGIYPKPAEVQRIIIVKAGRKDIADELDKNNQIFNYQGDHDCPCQMNLSNNNFNDSLSKALIPYLQSRSSLPSFLKTRMEDTFNKTAYYSSTEPGKDYWLREGQSIEQSTMNPALKAAGGLAALYAGLKLKSMGYGPKQLANIFVNKPWLKILLGGGVMWKIQNAIDQQSSNDPMLGPASDYDNILQNTNLSGHVKSANLNEMSKLGVVEESIILPSAYINSAVDQTSFKIKEQTLFPGAGLSFNKTASPESLVFGNHTLLTDNAVESLNEGILKILPKVR
jgi:hypothetical protein